MKLSKEAKLQIKEDYGNSLSWYQNQLKRLAGNKFLSVDTKIEIKQGYQRKINMYKEILKAVEWVKQDKNTLKV